MAGAGTGPVVVGEAAVDPEGACAVLGVTILSASGLTDGVAALDADGVLGLVAGALVCATAGMTRANVRAVAVMSDFIGCVFLRCEASLRATRDVMHLDSDAVSSLD